MRQRNLLRQRYLHAVSADVLAKILWLDQARARLLELLRARLAQFVPGERLQSVVGAMGSRLDLSVRRILDSHLETDPNR